MIFQEICFPILTAGLFMQYSEKEDKYEEEIKVLNDRLKEVSSCVLSK